MLIKNREARDHEANLRESFENLRKYNLILNLDKFWRIQASPDKIVKRAIELGEFDMRYKHRMSIKAQALAHFVLNAPTCRLGRYLS
ncbi:hypothetical protein LIER_25806 [Lithospermum erythrorhizon]|uniref:Uncharacterized protein n=1 Tax=Lithospermum erythrorhizon TaxID=34254 RepID=A0AAV3R7L3_LITER